MVAAANVTVFHTGLTQAGLVVLALSLLLGDNVEVLLAGQGHTAGNGAITAAHLDGVGCDDGIFIVA